MPGKYIVSVNDITVFSDHFALALVPEGGFPLAARPRRAGGGGRRHHLRDGEAGPGPGVRPADGKYPGDLPVDPGRVLPSAAGGGCSRTGGVHPLPGAAHRPQERRGDPPGVRDPRGRVPGAEARDRRGPLFRARPGRPVEGGSPPQGEARGDDRPVGRRNPATVRGCEGVRVPFLRGRVRAPAARGDGRRRPGRLLRHPRLPGGVRVRRSDTSIPQAPNRSPAGSARS